jgi:hypothetical protein
MGIIHNADGTFSTTVCRAKHPGAGRCPHFDHRANSKEAKAYISYLNKHKDEFTAVDFNRDSYSISESMRSFMIDKMGFDADQLDDVDTDDIKHAWFHDDEDAYTQTMSEAADGPLSSFKAQPSLIAGARKLVDNGVKIEVVADRVLGMKDDTSSDTSIWMGINGIDGRQPDGEPVVSIMVDPNNDEQHASASMRSNYVPKYDAMSTDEANAFKELGYASIR